MKLNKTEILSIIAIPFLILALISAKWSWWCPCLEDGVHYGEIDSVREHISMFGQGEGWQYIAQIEDCKYFMWAEFTEDKDEEPRFKEGDCVKGLFVNEVMRNKTKC